MRRGNDGPPAAEDDGRTGGIRGVTLTRLGMALTALVAAVIAGGLVLVHVRLGALEDGIARLQTLQAQVTALQPGVAVPVAAAGPRQRAERLEALIDGLDDAATPELRSLATTLAAGDRAAVSLGPVLADVATALGRRLEALNAAHRDASRTAIWLLVALPGFALAGIGTVLGLLHRRVMGPLDAMASALNALSTGSNVAPLKRGAAGGELDRMAGDLNTVAAESGRQGALLARYERQLHGEVALRGDILDGLPANIALLDAEGTVRVVNAAWRRFAREQGYADESLGVGVNYLDVCAAASTECVREADEVLGGLRAVLSGERARFEFEYACVIPDEQRWYRLLAAGVGSDEGLPTGAIVMHIDVTERRQAEDRARELAYRDALTGLMTRAALEEAMAPLFATAERCAPGSAFLVLIDVMQFHDVNEAHGYGVGNQLLTAIGQRLAGGQADHVDVARTGGDEFALLVRAAPATEAETVLQAVRGSLEASFRGRDFVVQLDAHVGVADLADAESVTDAFRRTELALLTAKRQADGRPVAFTPELEARTRERIRISDGLRVALNEGQFELHYQPKVDLRSGRLLAAEALIRWRHPEHGLLPPGQFVPVAESSQLIVPMGEWIIREACRNLRDWQAAGLDIVQVAVNVSLRQFRLSDVVGTVRSALAETGLAPGSLTLELTESVFEDDPGTVADTLRQLSDIGVEISLDDFGTGYSSLGYLQAYPFAEIKLDKSFVGKMVTDAYSRAIVEMVVAIGRTLGARVVGEGIERRADRDALLSAGCEVGQGFYYSMPLEREDFVWLLAEQHTLPVAAIRG